MGAEPPKTVLKLYAILSEEASKAALSATLERYPTCSLSSGARVVTEPLPAQ